MIYLLIASKKNLKINITYKEIANKFYYYPKFLFEINEIKELPQE